MEILPGQSNPAGHAARPALGKKNSGISTPLLADFTPSNRKALPGVK
jgi:hypothetical protein